MSMGVESGSLFSSPPSSTLQTNTPHRHPFDGDPRSIMNQSTPSVNYAGDGKFSKPNSVAVSIDITKRSRFDQWMFQQQHQRLQLTGLLERVSKSLLFLQSIGSGILRAVEAIDNPHVIVVIYFLLNLSMTMYNKVIMKLLRFNYPWLLTAIHTLLSCVGSRIFLGFMGSSSASTQVGFGYEAAPISPSPNHSTHLPHPTSADHKRDMRRKRRRNLITILLFSVLYTVNIAVSNVSLSMVSLPFHQVVRSTNPAVTLALEHLLFCKRVSNRNVYLALLMVIIGVALATLGEYEFSMPGLLMTLLGVFLSSLKGIFTNRLLVGSLKLHPLELLWRMSGLAAFQCIFVSWWSGEFAAFLHFISSISAKSTSLVARSAAIISAATAALAAYGGVGVEVRSDVVGPLERPISMNGTASFAMDSSRTFIPVSVSTLFIALLMNGVLAFFLNFISFMANRRVGALSMTVAGNVKQSMTITLSVWVFGYIITTLNGLGILLTLIGGAWYSFIGLANRKTSSKPS
ncbi:UAA transporter [Dinochytrium kinnereticum]|nr:UAA transporter [Dinochytrium kinnereticum]